MDGLSVPRRAAGVLIALLVIVPVHRLLAEPATGLAGEATARSADVAYAFAWTGTLVVVLIAALGARLVPGGAVEAVLGRMRRALERPSDTRFAAGAALLAFLLSSLFARFALHGRPGHLDALTQLLHARFIAAGMTAGPTSPVDAAFWQIQNSVVTAQGWVSQYPPGNVLLLAAGLLAGAAWLVGPVMVGVCTHATARSAGVLIDDRAAARAAALLVACSPFLICLGGSFMNHAPTAAFVALAVWFALRANADARWAFAAGAAVGAAFTVRPLTALAIGLTAPAVAWLADAPSRARLPGLVLRAATGALPFVALVALWNAHFFGSPTTFGYDVALGPAAGPGFGLDPWGNAYGPVQALAYTASDLVALGVALLETPLSPVLMVALLLVLAPRLTSGERVLVAWALAPLLANALYWHHGLYMGPRMLFEAAPAWILLAVSAVRRAWRYAGTVRYVGARAGLSTALACALAMAIWLAPQRAAGYAPAPGDVTAVRPPAVDGPALVFVHDAWTARLGMQLAAAGMRLDSVETALRQNPTCAVQAIVDGTGPRGRSALDFERRADALPPALAIATGSTIRTDPRVPPTAACVRQAASDRNGILDLAPLLWLGDLPGGPVHGALYVRDLGPARNAALAARLPERTPFVLLTPADGAAPVLLDYAAGMARLWGPEPSLETP